MGLEFLECLMRVVNQREPCALPSTVLGSEPKNGHLIFVHFVGFCQFGAKVFLGHVCAVGMKYIAFWLVISILATNDISCRDIVVYTHTTICFRPRSAFRRNFRVRSVTCDCVSAMIVDSVYEVYQQLCIGWCLQLLKDIHQKWNIEYRQSWVGLKSQANGS